MSITDFTKYPFANKTIRVRYDAEEHKHWFVIKDVLCVFFPNGEQFWEGLKNVLAAEGLSSPEAYVAYRTQKVTIDVADLQQMMRIIAYVPKRTHKKEMVAYWLYNHKESDKTTEQAALQPYEKKIITQIHQSESEVRNKKEESQQDVLMSTICLIAIIAFHILYTTTCQNDLRVHCLFVVGETIAFFARRNKIQNEKELQGQNRVNGPVPENISGKIVSILRQRVMTYSEKEAIVDEAVNSGASRIIANQFINTAIREAIITHKISGLTQCAKCQEKIPDDSEQCPFCGDFLIWSKIQKLTALALSDRVLTDLERQTIVNKAVEWGISSEEINQYLDDQLNLRLEYYTKVDLRDCPYCGAQIPLISDECMYCGKPLEHVDNRPPQPIRITSEEAEIIRSENQRVETKRHGIKHCPDCGAPFPLISNICQSCGHVLHERDENKLNIKNLLTKIEESILTAKLAEKPSAHSILSDYLYIFIMIVGLFSLYLGCIYHNVFLLVFAIIGCFNFVVFFILNLIAEKKSQMTTNEEYYKAQNSYEMYSRQVKTLYGDDPEAKPLLSRFAEILNKLKEDRRKNRIVIVRNILKVFGVVFGIILTFLVCDEGQQYRLKSKWRITPGIEKVYQIHKRLSPYPQETGVVNQLEPYLFANQETELYYVRSSVEHNTYRWKIQRIELGTYPNIDYDSLFMHNSLRIMLIDRDFRKIDEFSENVGVHNFKYSNHRKSKNKRIYFVDFWSEKSSSNEWDLERLAKNARYYTIELIPK